jgi:hypothetical protein
MLAEFLGTVDVTCSACSYVTHYRVRGPLTPELFNRLLLRVCERCASGRSVVALSSSEVSESGVVHEYPERALTPTEVEALVTGVSAPFKRSLPTSRSAAE